jgi:hypothetical protein
MADIYMYPGAFCRETGGTTVLNAIQSISTSLTAANIHLSQTVHVACPIIVGSGPDDEMEEYDACVAVQVYNAHESKEVECRIAQRQGGGATLLTGWHDGNVVPGRETFTIDAALMSDATMGVICKLPEMKPNASNVEAYTVYEHEC